MSAISETRKEQDVAERKTQRDLTASVGTTLIRREKPSKLSGLKGRFGRRANKP